MAKKKKSKSEGEFKEMVSYFKKSGRMTVLDSDDIDNWQCAYSVFTGKSCRGKYCKKCDKKKIKKQIKKLV